MLPPGKRSKEWQTAALSLDKKAPFGILWFTAKSITEDYYQLRFENNSDLNNKNL
jgi:hypothetical protein